VEFADVVRKRRMVHVFEPRPVDPLLVDRLLDTARRGAHPRPASRRDRTSSSSTIPMLSPASGS